MEEEEDEMGIDPAIAAAMGFSGFGTKPDKKRKYNSNDGFVDPSISQSQGTGANSVRVDKVAKLPEKPVTAPHSNAGPSTGTDTKNPSEATLEELKNGVRNVNGDMVYFMPSFLEDPWKDLKPK